MLPIKRIEKYMKNSIIITYKSLLFKIKIHNTKILLLNSQRLYQKSVIDDMRKYNNKNNPLIKINKEIIK
jgi:hypothetical protein